jgi:hypothetical protein
MAVRRGNRTTAAKATPARRGRPATSTKTTAKVPAKKAAAAKRKQDVTEYATKVATDYHKAFAKWAVQEVGYEPNEAGSKRAAFLKGIQIATAARPAFMESDFLAEWRESTGQAKRGPKPKDVTPAKVAPVADDDDDFDDDEIESDDDDFEDDDAEDDDSDDDDFEDDDDESDDEDEESDDDEDDEDFEDDEEEEEEVKPVKRRATPARTRKPSTPVRKAAPAKASARGRKPAPVADDEDLF